MQGELEVLVDELGIEALEIGVGAIGLSASPGRNRRGAVSRDMPSGMTLVPMFVAGFIVTQPPSFFSRS